MYLTGGAKRGGESNKSEKRILLITEVVGIVMLVIFQLGAAKEYIATDSPYSVGQ